MINMSLNFLREIRFFSSPLQTKNAEIFKSVPVDPDFPNLIADNLLENTDNRSTDRTMAAFDADGNAIPGIDYCYRVRAQELYQDKGGIYELTLKLESLTQVNAMIVYQDEA